MQTLLKNAHIVDPLTGTDEVADIAIVDGVIEKIGRGLAGGKGTESVDLRENIVAPGFIDIHVHLREPGAEYKETIETGCRSAAAGGFTAVCCMPNTTPAIDDPAVVLQIVEKARKADGGIVDVFPIAAVTKGREGKELAPLLELAEAGAVGFSDDGAPVEGAEIMRRALEYAAMAGRPVIQHAEEISLTRGGAMNEGTVSTALGLPPMPPVAEDIVVGRDLQLVAYCGSRYHVAHISTAGTVELVRRAKKQRLPVSCEVTPHHFTLTDEAVRGYDTNTKMNPPLRSRNDVEAIKEGLRDGTSDVIATDHAPHSFDEKQVEFSYAPFGIVGLETAVGLALTHLVAERVLTLPQMIEKFCTNPRAILQLPAVRIAAGEQANLTLLDTSTEWTVDVGRFLSKSKNSPFGGWRLKGKAIGIFNRGILRLTSPS